VIQYCKTNKCGVRYLEEVDIILEAVQDLKKHISASEHFQILQNVANERYKKFQREILW
jgi:hypothetical protein